MANYLAAKNYVVNLLKTQLPKHLTYHTLGHTLDVLKQADTIARREGVTSKEALKRLKTAAMFHDAGFVRVYNGHEAESCNIVRKVLPGFGYEDEQIEHICRIILATRIPQTPEDHLGAIMADADLDYLGREDFYTIGLGLKEELLYLGTIKNDSEWNKLQISFLKLHNYFTKTAINSRQKQKEKHLQALEASFS